MTADSLPPLVLAAHGSPHAAHGPAVLALRDAVARAAAGRGRVDVGWLGFAEPRLGDAVSAAARCGGDGAVSTVVVPLLLTHGKHALVDVPTAVRGVRGAVVAPVLAPDPLLAAALVRRLDQAGARAGDHVLVGGAGSGQAQARRQTDQVAALLAARWDGPVGTAYATGPGDRVAAAADRLPARGPGASLFVATFLLGPGTLADRLSQDAALVAGVATAPLGTAPEVVRLLLRRWAGAAASTLASQVA